VIEGLGEKMDEVYFATCVKKAKRMMSCPMSLDGTKAKIEEQFGVPVKVGTHDY
jgi:predicted metal-binding protein